MHSTEFILANLWIGLFAFFLLFYAITDGADLGLGMLTLISRSHKERDIMIGAITSTWHTNQTWLVVLGGMVFGAFPFFYGFVFSALYIPTMAMLFALIIRGVALDYHEHSKHKRLTGLLFGIGSLLTTVTQGFALGGFLGGIRAHGGEFAGGVWDWLTPFSGLVTFGVIVGYVLLGANFLVLKAEGNLQQRGYRYSFISALLLGPISAGVYLWMLWKYPHMVEKWTTVPDVFWVGAAPFLTLITGGLLVYSLRKRYETAPIFLTGATILLSFAGISFALYPHMIPNVITRTSQIVGAAASLSTLIFMSIVAAVIIPVILLYNGYNEFWVFRGKIREYFPEDESEE